MKFGMLAFTVLLALSPMVHAQENPARESMLLTVFAKTCLKYAGKPTDMKVALEGGRKSGLPMLHQRFVKPFLGRREGTGWLLHPDLGQAILVLRDDGVCSIFVRKWDNETFESLLMNFFEKKVKVFSLNEINRKTGVLNSTTWGLDPAGRYKALLDKKGMKTGAVFSVTLSTSKKRNGAFQLALTLGRL